MRWNLLLATVAASWGFVSVIAAAVDVRPEGLVFWRSCSPPRRCRCSSSGRAGAVPGRLGRAVASGDQWLAVLVLGLVLTGGMGALYVWNLHHVTAQAAGLLAYVEPVSASVLAWAILGQALGWQVALGGAAVLAGGALVVVYEAADSRSVEAPLLVPEEEPAFRMVE